MSTPTPPSARAPADYTGIGYDALRASMLEMARAKLPEWTDHSEGDLGVLLIELFAYAADLTLYYQTRIAANLLPETSDEPEALVQLLRLIGYELAPPAPASADLEVAFDAGVVPPVTLPAGTAFTVSAPGGRRLRFETPAEVVAERLSPPGADGLRRFYPLPVVEGTTVVDDPVAVSDGRPNQLYPLRRGPVIRGSISVTVDEPGGTTAWTEVPSLAASTPVDRHYVSRRDAAGGAEIRFGDGVNGMVPPPAGPTSPVLITARYRVGGGRAGNVGAGQAFVPAGQQIRQAVNPRAAAGGAEAEDLERARALAPRLYRSQDRAVTLDDHADIARLVPGVGKVKPVSASWNEVVLHVAPAGRVAPPSETLVRDVLAHFERYRMATQLVTVVGPAEADVYLAARVWAQPYFTRAAVRRAVEEAVGGYLGFEQVDFGQRIFLSRIYDLLQDLEQVASLTVVKFGRDPALPADIVTAPQVEPTGIIELAPHELPRPGYRDNPPATSGFDLSGRPAIVTIIEGGVA
ncbi:putative baseplate assembly protein [Actinomadura graeca]|uniref:Baseplate assembly protein n=1 Tax=Actinomadura graeca TaxID=2750812 RepID=A0ABX8QTI0_9ACTN|nr:putative baseplate assembly protein [Actinomadura graeca]QXJ21264.1 putative baseplate assembly protein [Actinomadura graeca]